MLHDQVDVTPYHTPNTRAAVASVVLVGAATALLAPLADVAALLAGKCVRCCGEASVTHVTPEQHRNHSLTAQVPIVLLIVGWVLYAKYAPLEEAEALLARARREGIDPASAYLAD